MTPPVRFLPGNPASRLLAAGLLGLLLILASLQYRWLEEVSRADRDKSQDLLQAAVDRFAEDFDRELTRAFLYFQPRGLAFSSLPEGGSGSPELEDFARRHERWRSYAPFPDLVRNVYLARHGAGGAFEALRFDPAAGAFTAVPWPAELAQVRERLAAERRWIPRPDPREGASRPQFLADDVPALILPAFGAGPPGDPGRPPSRPEAEHSKRRPARPEGGRGGGPPIPGLRGFLVVLLDLETLRETILPRLTEQHLNAGDGTRFEARVVTLRDQRVIFRRGAPSGGGDGDGDASATLFGLLPPQKLGALELEAGPVTPEARRQDRRPEVERSVGTEPGVEPAPGMAESTERGRADRAEGRALGRRLREGLLYHRLYRFMSTESARWRLVASHPAGSLDAAVGRAHRRNLAISFGILLLLGASLMLMLLSTRRLQALARQQLEFVAGVTHELLTPLAAMRSAGQNLADGVVAEPRQVRRYGRLVEDEGRRLSTMVEQVLELAGMQAGRRSYTLERTRLEPIVDGALAEYGRVLEEQGTRVEKSLDEDLPEIMADAAALRRAVQNLVANAVKYGATGRSEGAPAEDSWIGLRAVVAGGPKGRELRLSVEDRGPGIAAADLPHLFEPFYRGRNGSAGATPGGGLGLALVKHIVEGHGGRVTVSTRVGSGSTFTLHLPAAGGDGPGGVTREQNDEH